MNSQKSFKALNCVVNHQLCPQMKYLMKENENLKCKIEELEASCCALSAIINKARKSNGDHREPIIYCKFHKNWTNDWDDDIVHLNCCLECLPEVFGYCEKCEKYKKWDKMDGGVEVCNDCYVSDAED